VSELLGHASAILVGATLVGLGRYVWRLVFPPPGRYLFTINVDDPALIEVDGEATALVHAIGDGLARYLREHPRAEWPAALVVEVMPRP
jgi:hypothetical protein